jgi:hypothetical protein
VPRFADLVAGRFDDVPDLLPSGTHTRLFTRRAWRDLFAPREKAVPGNPAAAVVYHPFG